MNGRPDTLYAVKPVGLDGPVKIGVTSDISRRFRHICNQSPLEMELLCTLPGDIVTERRIHHALIGSHLRCEWFEATDEVRAMVAAMTDGSFQPDHLPAPKGVSSFVRGKPVVRA